MNSAKVLHEVTPLIKSPALLDLLQTNNAQKILPNLENVYLKMDCDQPSGSFKLRGIGNMCQKAVLNGATTLIGSSGGNAGLALAYSAKELGVQCIVVVPESTPEYMREQLSNLGAKVHVVGKVWDEANAFAKELCLKNPLQSAFIPPFDHPHIWEGNSSVVDEIKAQMEGKKPDLILLSVGGGGYFSGVCEGLQRHGWVDTAVMTLETEGASSLYQSVLAGKRITLNGISSVAKSLGAQCVAKQAFEWTQNRNTISRTVTDEQAIDACLKFEKDHSVQVEPACGATLAPIYSGLLPEYLQESKNEIHNICLLICGGKLTEIPFKNTT